MNDYFQDSLFYGSMLSFSLIVALTPSFSFLRNAGIVADSNAYDQSKRMRTGGDYTHTGYSSPSPFHPPPAPVWGHG